MSPGSSSADADGDDRDDETGPGEGDGDWPKDPVLYLFEAVEKGVRGVDSVYDYYERLPGWAHFGIGIGSFLVSTYFAPVVRAVVDALVEATLTPLLSNLVGFRFGTKATLLLLTAIASQVAVANKRLTIIGYLVESEEMESEETATDGGMQVRRIRSTGSGASGGAAIGVAFGALFGYVSTMFGGMILGAIVGDEIERWWERRRKKRTVKTRVVAYLLRQRVFPPDTVEVGTVRNWFPPDDEAFVTEALDFLVGNTDSPVVKESDGIRLEGAPEAVAYLDRNGGRIPPAFAGPNRPPRPSEGED